MKLPIFRASLTQAEHVVQARQWARAVATGLGFSLQDQTRIATAVSEIARNAVAYANGGRVEFVVDEVGRRPALIVRVSDSGGGIAHLDSVIGGKYRSNTGLGLGIVGAKRLMDSFDISTGPSGTTVTMAKVLPSGLGAEVLRTRVHKAAELLERMHAPDPVEEVNQQNRELLTSLARLREREEQLLETNQELRDTADALSSSLQEKDVLIREVHHRVKNNLQIITSLISLQSARSGNADAQRELSSLSGRIRSLSLIHDKLYQGDNLARIDLRDYIMELCSHLEASFAAPGGGVSLNCELCRVALPLDAAINIGLIINELVTNAYKHAFRDRETGQVSVTAALDSGALTLTVADDGKGLPEGEQSRRKSLGMTLVHNMTARLGGTVAVETGAGTRTSITLPLPEGTTQPTLPRESAVA